MTSYSWSKTGGATGVLELKITALSVAQTLRLEVIFSSAADGTYRQSSDLGGAVVEGNISFAPVPQDNIPPLLNLSTRTALVPGPPSIAGFVVSGSTSRRVLIRAIGPSLAQFGVASAVANPALAIFKGNIQIGANAGWGGAASLAAIFSTVGAFALPANSRDCALVLTLDPGNYTAQVRSDAAGEVLLEVYFVD